MRIASIPYNEELRLQDLYSYDILDSEAEKEFDNLLELAADICNCSIAAITFIDSNRQWLKSKIGITDSETPRDVAFCAHTILQNEVLQVKDTTLDERFCNNPLVTEALFIRFYAGAPIVSATGYNLGAVCVIDQEPKELTPEQNKVLIILSKQVSKILELRIKNKVLKRQIEEQLQHEKSLLQRTLQEQEVERSSISFELHENIAQCIAATKFYLEIAEDAGADKNALIKKSRDMMVNLLSEVQDLSKLLSPTTLKDVYLKDSIEYILKDFTKKSNIESKFLYEATKELQPDIAKNVFRIIEEQLNNIKEHSKATSVIIYLQISQSLFLSIKDNGIGIDLKKFQKGIGINKMLSRIESFNGTMDISGGFSRGCEMTITLPLDTKAIKKNLNVVVS